MFYLLYILPDDICLHRNVGDGVMINFLLVAVLALFPIEAEFYCLLVTEDI